MKIMLTLGKNENQGPERPAYICTVCDEIFDIPELGHCPRCAHHYIAGDECHNCHRHTIRKTMKKTGHSIGHFIRLWKEADERRARA